MDDSRNMWEFGQTPIDEVNQLVKALQANDSITDIANLQGGGALQPQSLETTLAMLTFQEKHLKFYKDIGTQKAFSTLEEYSVQDGYGTEGGFVDQIENPLEGDPDFRRKFAFVKYIRTMWRVPDVLSMVRQITSAEVLSVQAAVMRALRVIEKTLFFGDSDLLSQSFDGLQKVITNEATTDHIVDLRGGDPTEQSLRIAAELISSNYGTATSLYLSNGAQSKIDLLINLANNVRVMQPQMTQTQSGLVALGHTITEMRTSFGNFAFKPDIFLNIEGQGVPKIKDPSNPANLIEGATSTQAPATPVFTLSASAGATAGSKWVSSGEPSLAGSYRYRVVAVNQYGKSQAAAVQLTTSVAGRSVAVKITSGGGSYAPQHYEVYRSPTAGSAAGTERYMTSIKKAATTVTTLSDLNEWLPGTSRMFLVDNSVVGENRTMAFSQLAPVHKTEFAKIGPYRWGNVNFYGVPKWYAPLRFVMFKNVGVVQQNRNPLVDL